MYINIFIVETTDAEGLHQGRCSSYAHKTEEEAAEYLLTAGYTVHIQGIRRTVYAAPALPMYDEDPYVTIRKINMINY